MVSGFANLREEGVRIPPVRGKQWLASMESSVNFRGEKAWKRLMPLAFRQWHLYRFAIMVPVVGLEPTRCCHQRILSPHRLPFRHTGVRIAFILYYAAFVKSSVFCPQNAKKTISGLFSARRRAGLCRRGALPVSAAQKDSRRGLPVSAVQRDSRRALPVSAVQRDSRRGLPVPAAQRDSRRGLPQQASHC